MSYFADTIKQLRLSQGLTQAALAEKLHVTQNAIFNWENGKREPKLEMIHKIADYFQVSAAYLFAEEDSYRTMLRFLDEAARRMNLDEAGYPFAAIEFTETDKPRQRLFAYAKSCYEWYQKTYEPLNEDGRRKVEEYAEILSESERFQRKPERRAI